MAPDHHQEPAQRARNSGQSELVLYPVLNPRLNANRAVAVVLLSSHGEGQRHGQCARCASSTHCRAILPGSLHHLRAAAAGSRARGSGANGHKNRSSRSSPTQKRILT